MLGTVSQVSDPVTTSAPPPAVTLSCEHQQAPFGFLWSSQQLLSISQRSPITVAYTRWSRTSKYPLWGNAHRGCVVGACARPLTIESRRQAAAHT